MKNDRENAVTCRASTGAGVRNKRGDVDPPVLGAIVTKSSHDQQHLDTKCDNLAFFVAGKMMYTCCAKSGGHAPVTPNSIAREKNVPICHRNASPKEMGSTSRNQPGIRPNPQMFGEHDGSQQSIVQVSQTPVARFATVIEKSKHHPVGFQTHRVTWRPVRAANCRRALIGYCEKISRGAQCTHNVVNTL